MKKTVHECDFCHRLVNRDDIHKFKETKYSMWDRKWKRTKFDVCSDCYVDLNYSLYKKRLEKERGEKLNV